VWHLVNEKEVYTEDGGMKWQGKRCTSFVTGVDVYKLANCDAGLNIRTEITFRVGVAKTQSNISFSRTSSTRMRICDQLASACPQP